MASAATLDVNAKLPIIVCSSGGSNNHGARGDEPLINGDLIDNNNRADAKPKTVELNLPRPSFRLLHQHKASPKKPLKVSGRGYYRYVEPTPDALYEMIEYDMDDEDTAWLDFINEQRREQRLPPIKPNDFEVVMDKLEKESYFPYKPPSVDEDAVCEICNDGDCQNSNQIIFCDMCNLAVHQECYGVPYVPEGQWLCRRCLHSPSKSVDCVLCPNKGGAMKRTEDNRWAHVICALWVPEVCFANTAFLEPIDGICNIPSARWKFTCYICKKKRAGACIQCNNKNCYVAFHVTCAQQAGLYMKIQAVKFQTEDGITNDVEKAVYCDAHTPKDEAVLGSGMYSNPDDDDDENETEDEDGQVCRFKRISRTKIIKDQMKKARKKLAKNRNACNQLTLPKIPENKLPEIVDLIKAAGKEDFVRKVMGYWALKRKARNGVPLIRRLQMTHNSARRDEESRHQYSDEDVEQIQWLRGIRFQLEKVRLLVELVRKREQSKKRLFEATQNVVSLQLRLHGNTGGNDSIGAHKTNSAEGPSRRHKATLK